LPNLAALHKFLKQELNHAFAYIAVALSSLRERKGQQNVPLLSRVLVVGGGIGGLTVGGALAANGIAVDIIEKRDENFALGIGIIQPANALRALRTLGLLDACITAGFATDEWRYFEPDGTPLTSFKSLRMAGPDLPAYNAIPRPALHRILTEYALGMGAQFHLGTTVVSIEERPDVIRVTLSNGTMRDYDLMIGADGLRSQIRGMLFPEIAEPVFSGLSAWRFPVDRPAELTYQAMYFGVGTKAGLVPIAEHDMYLLLVTHEPGNPWFEAEALPGLLYDRLSDFEALRDIRDQIEPGSNVVYSPIEEVPVFESWHRGHALLIGDAAHASGPHLSQGATMAVEDAVVLAELTKGDDPLPDVFDAFMKRRYERCRFVQSVTHEIGESGNLLDPEKCRLRNESFRKIAPGTPRAHELRLAEPI
jgi:2-polyprenyl-6-methoxyphenol hydroxylase-like FAD-dependent oxidoreductase